VFLTLKDFVKQSIFTQVILDHTASLDLFLFFKVINYDVHTYILKFIVLWQWDSYIANNPYLFTS